MEIDFNKYPLPKKLRHHTAANLYFPLEELKNRPPYYPPLIKKISWQDYFDDGKPPAILDIGCAKGKLLLDLTELKPDKNLLGIEVRKILVDWLDELIRKENIPNAAVIWFSVVNGLPFIESNSIDKILYLFPDPWPKRKHHKRRAFNLPVLQEFYRLLKTDAKLYLATDVEEVHEYHLQLLRQSDMFDIEIIENDNQWDLPATNKEVFCRRKNIHFDRIIAVKK